MFVRETIGKNQEMIEIDCANLFARFPVEAFYGDQRGNIEQHYVRT